jgi:uncharacterized protein YqeY
LTGGSNVPLVNEVTTAIADAMRKQDGVRLSSLRMLKAALMNKEVERGRGLDDAESLQVVQSLVKQRKDSIEQFAKGGRQDLVDKGIGRDQGARVISPPAADPAVIERAVADAILDRRLVSQGHGRS